MLSTGRFSPWRWDRDSAAGTSVHCPTRTAEKRDLGRKMSADRGADAQRSRRRCARGGLSATPRDVRCEERQAPTRAAGPGGTHAEQGGVGVAALLAEGGEEVALVLDALACLGGRDYEVVCPVASCGVLDFVPGEGGSDLRAWDAAE
jgi:hypothetical protein